MTKTSKPVRIEKGSITEGIIPDVSVFTKPKKKPPRRPPSVPARVVVVRTPAPAAKVARKEERKAERALRKDAPLARFLKSRGLQARLVVTRIDGKPLTREDVIEADAALVAFEAADRRAWKAAGKAEAAPVEKAPTSKRKAAKRRVARVRSK